MKKYIRNKKYTLLKSLTIYIINNFLIFTIIIFLLALLLINIFGTLYNENIFLILINIQFYILYF